MIPACFSNPNMVSSHLSQAPQNLTTCIYQVQLCNSPVLLTLTWSKTLHSHSLTIYASDCFCITISLSQSTFSLFKNRPGSKSIQITQTHQKMKLYWDFTRSKFTPNSAEPDSSFYIALTCNSRIEFFLGDLKDELTRRSGLSWVRGNSSGPTLLSRREHVFGRRNYVTRAQFMGTKHDIEIECSGGVLRVKIDGATCLAVKRLTWKFRGNEKILIDGKEVEFYWDVFNWVSNNGSANNNGVFVFQVGDGGVIWPEMVGPEKRLMRKSLSGATTPAAAVMLSPAGSCSSVLQWAEDSSDCGRSSSSSSSTNARSCGNSGGGFSLVLYAWRRLD
ncbi:hypothetical protein Ancab_000896 [Ancistrocladus abbreviatus]